MNIYQEIWHADMKNNGIPPILTTETSDISEGYVIVDIKGNNSKHHILKEVVIPQKKELSYQMVEKLFDNYSLNQKNKEKNTLAESKEVEDFLIMAIDSNPLKIAKSFIEKKLNKRFTNIEWFSYLHDLWFRQFNWNKGKNLSAFEHIFIGEQKKRKLIGHHFWYKYWLEDNAEINNHNIDQIELICGNPSEQTAAPYAVTVGCMLNAFDHKKRRFIEILKNRCAFFVGISAEGILALGTVRATQHNDIPENLIINNKIYKLELFMSPDCKSIRTFYPLYIPS